MGLELPTGGAMRDRIHFERNMGRQVNGAGQNIGGENVGGEFQDNWQVYAPSRNAMVTPTRGGDQVIAGRLSGDVGYDIWVRYDVLARGLKAGDRAVNDRTGEVYVLGLPIDPNGRRQWLLIQATSKGIPSG